MTCHLVMLTSNIEVLTTFSSLLPEAITLLTSILIIVIKISSFLKKFYIIYTE